MSPRTRSDQTREAVHTFKGARRDESPGLAPLSVVNDRCETCLAPMKPGAHGQRRRLCSAKCRRLACSFRQLTAAIRAGHTEGLRDRIQDLGREASVRHQAGAVS
jgi:hypothetical protein